MSKRSAKAKIKVWILDNHPVVVAGLSRMMANHPELKVAATANRMAELPRLANAPPPDVVIMDMNEPGVDGSAVLRRLARHVHPAKVLVFSSQGGRDTVLHMVRGGVGGYLHKKAGEGEILHAVKSVGQGDTYLGQKAAVYLLEEFTRPGGGVSRPEPQASREEGASAEEANAAGEGDVPLGQDVVAYLNKKLADPGVAKPARRPSPRCLLTCREMEILKLLGKQLDSHGIGKKLGLSPRTVDTHSNRIREKLGLPNQQALRDFVLKPTWRNRVRVLQDKPPQADKGWKEDVGRD